MSDWFLVLTFVAVALAVTYALAEWLSQRYSAALRRRMGPFAPGEPRDAGGRFDQDERGG